jgi:hypothetical protein
MAAWVRYIISPEYPGGYRASVGIASVYQRSGLKEVAAEVGSCNATSPQSLAAEMSVLMPASMSAFLTNLTSMEWDQGLTPSFAGRRLRAWFAMTMKRVRGIIAIMAIGKRTTIFSLLNSW